MDTKIAARSLGSDHQAVAMPSEDFGGAAGVLLILAGTVMVALAAVRFVRTGRAIDSAEPGADSARVDLALAGIMVALGIALVIYLVH
jgi:putative membrane protein